MMTTWNTWGSISFAIAAVWFASMPASAAQIFAAPQKIYADNGGFADKFGYCADLSGDTAIVTAFRGIGARDSGSVYLYRKNRSGEWHEASELTQTDVPLGNGFGKSISISGNTAIVGAYGDEQAGRNAGAAYIFQEDGFGNWSQVAKLFASDPSVNYGFGTSVDIDGDRAIVSAEQAVYLFRQNNFGEWVEVAKRVPDEYRKYFGHSVAIDGQTAVVGGPGNGDLGAAYVYREDLTGEWNLATKFSVENGTPPDVFGQGPSNSFGQSVAISGQTIIVGGRTSRDVVTQQRSVAAYIYREDQSGAWHNEYSFVVDASLDERADKFVSISGDLAVVGVARDEIRNYGSGHVLRKQGNSWTEIGSVEPSPLTGRQFFGISAAVDGDTVVFGAYGDDGVVPRSGAAYMIQVIPEPSSLVSAAIVVACVLVRGRQNTILCRC